MCLINVFVPFLVTNYAQLDGVFAIDSPICAANLKRMWCEYACNPTKADFRKFYDLKFLSALSNFLSSDLYFSRAKGHIAPS